MNEVGLKNGVRTVVSGARRNRFATLHWRLILAKQQSHWNARNLGITKKPSKLELVGLGALIVLATSIIVTVAETSSSCPERQRYVCAYAFKSLPKGLLINGEIEFERLNASKLSLVRITPNDARRIADAQYGHERDSRVTFESLGGFVDKSQIVHDWVGNKSWVPKSIPSYVVRIYGAQLVTLDPSNNHYWNVIVSAVSGKILTAFTYD